jgi:ABC-type Fe3+ transport system substrate-binding protein
MPLLRLGLLLCQVLIICGLHNPARAAWEEDWKTTLAEAKKEGEVRVYIWGYQDAVQEFEKAYPDIKVSSFVGVRGADIASKLMAERRAGKYLADLYMTGLGTHIQVLHPAAALASIPPALILPEVKDQSKWFRGIHHYIYPEEGYSFVFEMNVSRWIYYNTNLVKPDEIKSWWDLTLPKWRGKLLAYDPTIPGAAAPALWFFYRNPALGSKFIEALYGGMNITVSRDPRQTWDWLANGKSAICIACRGWSKKLQDQGLPVSRITHPLREGEFVAFGNGIVSLINPAPHPNAAKVFLNWWLSRKGQTAFQEISARSGEPKNSLRVDIPKEIVPSEEIPQEGFKYSMEGKRSAEEREEAVKIFNRVIGK